MSVLAWVALGVTAWIVLGIAVALLVGRMVRQRDRQVPDDVRRNAADSVPSPRTGGEQSSALSVDEPTGRRGRGVPPVR